MLQHLNSLLTGALLLLVLGCVPAPAEPQATEAPTTPSAQENETAMIALLERHLAAVAGRDLETLAATLAPDGRMQLILPGTKATTSAQEFMDYHVAWFQDTTWTFETRVLNARAGQQMGMAVVEAMYREPERDGQPYFNRMIVSYDLAQEDGQWYVIKDHASSVEKSTDAAKAE